MVIRYIILTYVLLPYVLLYIFFSVQEYLSKPVAENTVTTPKVKKTLSLPATHAGNLIDNLDVLATFTIENVLDYLVNHKESDCMKAEALKLVAIVMGMYRILWLIRMTCCWKSGVTVYQK